MKNRVKLLLLAAFLFHHNVFAQQAEMADAMRADGKIYVVVSIILVIFVGLILFLIRMDRNVSKLEKKISKG